MHVPVIIAVLFFSATAVMAQQKRPSVVDSLKHQLVQARHDSTRLRLCVAISDVYLTHYQFDSLYHYTRRGLALLARAPSAYYAGDLYHFLARYHRSRGLYQQGIPPIRQAINYARQARSVKKTALFQYTLAMIYSDAGDLSSAVDQIGTNLKYLRDHTDGDMLAANYLLMIELFKALNSPSMQELYTTRYLALITPAWPPDHRMLACELKAEMLEKRGRLKEAEKMYRLSMRYARQTGNPVHVIALLGEQGINLRKQRRYRAAIGLFGQGFALARSIKSASDMGVSKRELASTYLAAKQPREALPEARYALTLARQNKQVDGLVASLHCLALVLEANGQYQEALRVFREEDQLKEQHFTEKNMQKIAYMQAQFEAETKEKTINILQKNAQITRLNTIRQEEQLTLARRTQLAAVAIIGLLFVLMGVVYYFLRKSQRSYAELTHQQHLLQQTASELAETNLVKDKLFSLVSHDLRSPVARLKQNFHQLRQETPLLPALVKPLGHLENQVDQVLNLLTNLLDWSHSQLKGMRSTPQRIDLAEAAAEAVSQLADHLRQKDIQLLNHIPRHTFTTVDKHQFNSILRNVLSNAVKFTPAGGYIRLEAKVNAHEVILSIKDTGIGMSAEQLACLLTDPQVRPGTRGELSTGLGLRLCQDLLARQAGSLQITSQPHKGTTVRLSLVAATPVKQQLLPSQANDSCCLDETTP